MMEELQVFSLADPQAEQFRASAQEIYEEAFEPEEKVPFEGLWNSAHRSHADAKIHLWGLRQDSSLLATAWFCNLLTEHLGYLGYLAVTNRQRSRGYGDRMMRRVLQGILEEQLEINGIPPLATFWEVRDPADAPDAVEASHRQRRIQFYRRVGAELLPVDYLCPPITPGQPPVKFLLMAVTYPPGGTWNQENLRQIALTGLIRMNDADPQSEYVQRALASIESGYT